MSDTDAGSWRAVDAALDALLEHPEAERAAKLADLRARDAAVAREVERLLAAQPAMHAQRFLEDAAAGLMPTGAAPGDETLPSPTDPALHLPPGAVFGAYRLIRVLGHGGMGIVYEADEIESGRRVALKVLKDSLGDARERARFEREGRLAASLNHPNCVFVFAATEVDGRAAIAMELMQRTLADRLQTAGPLAPAAAVDAVLQLVEGLRAAASLGVLHRDVKPSNCFVDADDTVKIGDFGISRSLRPTQETDLSTRGQLAATPAYAAPEQLRGERLDARADIYSLGATLYELLTGRRPFERPDLLSLLTAVAMEAPAPPHVHVPAIPRGLSRIVLRCLAKAPDDRFADYGALAAALAPFSSIAPRPAMLGRRALAGAIDVLLWGLPFLVSGFWHEVGLLPGSANAAWFAAADFLLPLTYFAIVEGIWGASVGKALCGLRVVRADGGPAGIGRIVIRAVVFLGALNLLDACTWLIWGAPPAEALFDNAQDLIWLALVPLFATARQSNGYAALQDRASGTRVVDRRTAEGRTRIAAPAPGGDAPPLARAEGFAVVGERVPGLPEGWHEALDTRLRRRVWMRRLSPGTPPVSLARRAVARSTRLRWIAGRRHGDEAWDVYDAVAGRPLAEICAQGRADWAEARWWMLDLAREGLAGAGGDNAPPRVDRVWIREDGGAVLLDDPSIDLAAPGHGARASEWIALLRDVARLALPAGGAAAGGRPPCPVHARHFLERLDREPCVPLEDLARDLQTSAQEQARVTRAWRALPIGLAVVFPLIVSVLGTSAIGIMASRLQRVPEPLRLTAAALHRLDSARQGNARLTGTEQEQIETALVTRHRDALADARLFGEFRSALRLRTEHQVLAKTLLERATPTATPASSTDLPPAIVRNVRQLPGPPGPGQYLMLLSGVLAVGLIVTGLISLAGAAAFRGVLLRLAGLEIVRNDGRPASRPRVIWRTLVVWAPMLVLLLGTVRIRVGSQVSVHVDARGFFDPSDRAALGDILIATTLLVMLAGMVLTILRPGRGLQDRLAGTWVVSR